ncbi:transcriptional regulator, ArsR family [Vibrio xiamenensis]|uniref:Transcriptional regulator, ArsR family n=1 Tax=Vibrio xiamenensis TaxID=861298 RepID=A0A1G8H9Q3_9VIBR|nr:metalloregulator ArsR/SmtB family transcription factor [Vibrio xiamenensis]SDI03394.1 transcriptional regulator, ArsR family [Vibrio xiamenensis]
MYTQPLGNRILGLGDRNLLNSYAYENVGEFAKALGHEKRLFIIKLLSSHERCVEDLATAMGIGVKSVSAHLKVMRTQGIVISRKEGLRVYYRLRNDDMLKLFQSLWEIALSNKDITPFEKNSDFCLTLKELLSALESNNTLLLDVRESDMYEEGHIPGAISIPVDELNLWAENYDNSDEMIVVYCEGYYCIQAIDATNILKEKGLNVKMYRNGLDEWAASGFDINK